MSSTEDTEIDGDLSGGSIRNQHRHGEGVHPVGATGTEMGVLLVHRCETTDAGADHDGDSVRVDACGDGGGHGPGLPGCHQGELGTAVRAATQQWREAVQGAAGNATGQTNGQIVRPRSLKKLNAAATGHHRIPGGISVETQGIEGTPTHNRCGLSSGCHQRRWC